MINGATPNGMATPHDVSAPNGQTTLKPGNRTAPGRMRPTMSNTPVGAETSMLYGRDMAAPMPPIEWLCAGLRLTSGAPTLVAGSSYSGKSMMLADLAIAVAAGGQAFGHYECRCGDAIILDFDGQGRRVSVARLQRLVRARDIDIASLDEAIAYSSRPGFYLDSPDAAEHLHRCLDGRSLCIVDSWRGATPDTNEWDRAEVQGVAATLEKVSEATGCVIIVVDHHVKPSREGGSLRGAQHDVHGSTAKSEIAQAHFSLSSKTPGEIIVRHVKERVTGKALAPFHLRIEDVERDGDAVWGVRLVHVTGEKSDGVMETRSDHRAEVRSAVLDCIRRNPGIAGAERVQRAVGKKATDVRGAVNDLVAEGQIIRRKGSRNSVRLYDAADGAGEKR
jgi:hypothetical protein